MKRLTKAHYNGKGYYMTCSEDCNSPADCIDCAALDNLVGRLAAYEDTGLTPEEIDGLPALWAERMKEVSELQEAKDAGRLVVLPCKVGDTVYRVWNTEGRAPVIESYHMKDLGMVVRWMHYFGKTVFLTREEAEEAMEGGNNDEVCEAMDKKIERLKERVSGD